MKRLINFIKMLFCNAKIEPENEELIEFRKRVKELNGK